jgi:hypothetical protein
MLLKQELISSDSYVSKDNTIIGRKDTDCYNFMPVQELSSLGLSGLKYKVYYTDGTNDTEIGTVRRYVIGPFIYLLGVVYTTSIPNDASAFRLKFQDYYGAYGVKFADIGKVTGDGTLDATQQAALYRPISLTSVSNIGQIKTGGIDDRDNNLYFWESDGTALTCAEAKTFSGTNKTLRFYGLHLIHLTT